MRNWEAIKGMERPGKSAPLSWMGCRGNSPALMRRRKSQKKQRKWVLSGGEDIHGAFAAEEELAELRGLSSETRTKSHEFGDVLFALVNVARYAKVDPEMALREATSKFIQRFQFIEEQARAAGLTPRNEPCGNG